MGEDGMPEQAPHPMRLPLTAGQHGIWFAQRLAPTNPTYITAEYVDIHGPVDVEALRGAVRRALAEARCLHIRCGEDGTGPWQIVDVPEDIPVTLLDLSTASDPQAAAEQWMRDDLATPIDIYSGPLFTEALLSLGGDRHLWYQKFHHLVMDGFSHSLIARQVADLYSDVTSGREPAPADFGQLQDLVRDDADYQASPAARTDREFWRATMSGVERVPSLSERRAAMAHSSLHDTHYLPEPDLARLRTAARSLRSHWNGLFIAALAAYTHRVTGAEDIVLGLPVTARRTPAAQRTPGMVSNLVPLRLSVSPGMTLSELVRHVVAQTRLALKHQRYRYEDIRRDLGLLHDGGALCGPHINLMPFDYDLAFGDAAAVSHALATGPVEDLTLAVIPREGGLRLVLNANPDRYTSAELAGHLKRYLTVLDTFVTDPELPVDDIDILDPAERRQLLSWARSGGTAATAPGVLPGAFEAQARRFPERTAVTCEGTELGYGELNTRANQLARRLTEAGAGPHRHVALALPRSPDLVMALLAVLKSGAAYIPVDPDYPSDRITHILGDARPQLLVTTRALAARLPDDGRPRLLLDDPGTRAALASYPSHDVQDTERTAPLAATHPAYVIYTSGSTGTPKGVVVTHRNVMSLLSSTRGLFGFGPDDVWTLFHSYAFDFSVWEIWGALLHGGRLVVVPGAVARSPEAFLALLATEGVTVLNQTPSAFHQLMQAEQDAPDLAEELALRYVIFGGEALDLGRLGPWYERHTDESPRLVNMYGITETTVHSTHLPLTAKLVADDPGSVIGVGLPNVEVYVLDRALRPVPAGITGEIYVGGDQVTDGYLHRPELTEQRFLPHPFGPPGARLYRTGDLARWLPDGLLEYRGRADDQVKVRGFRIELGEVEAALKALPEVADARALVSTDAVGDAVLRAYAIPARGASPGSGALRTALRDTLPGYMVPASVVVMDAFPLTAHGKLDRAALPAPAPAVSRTPTPARDPLERQIARAWSLVLAGTAPGDIGIDDDFFDLGGDSFKAVRAARDIGHDASAIDVFKHPTPRRLAAHLRTTAREATVERWLHTLTPARPAAPRLSLICIPYGGGSATAFQQLATCLPADVELRAVALPGHDPALPAKDGPALREAAKRLAEEITETVNGPFALYGHCVGTALTMLTARELEDRDSALRTVHLAAALPDPDPRRSLAALEARTDDALYAYLRSLGGFNGVLDAGDLRRVLKLVRHAMVEGAAFQIEAVDRWEKLRTPVHVVVGDADPATAGYEDGYLGWGRYAHHTRLSVLPGAGHYFVKDRPEPLAALLAAADAHAV
ncbi:non-ribosomal peptide synthetase [Streptomyces filipinensis]|uniref:Non-ribosomal peptide synthetase n=2 Tax=Streptomyces filipinensis TaxID=66887 RepID=A0A918MBG9_9ACTN|nr:non-ribosomal peptide synthetase [Streptomyces filipinensis]